MVKCAGRHDDHAALAVLNTGTPKPGSIPEETETMEIAAELLHEIDILSSMRHPDMVMFIGPAWTSSFPSCASRSSCLVVTWRLSSNIGPALMNTVWGFVILYLY